MKPIRPEPAQPVVADDPATTCAVAGITLLDDATRPTAPAIAGVTAAQRAHGRRLGLYHRMHLDEFAKVKRALDRFIEGSGTLNTLQETIASMAMVANYQAFGTLCGRQCMLLTEHHTIEDQGVFPILRRNDALRPVIDRLSAEHRTVHALIERVQELAASLARNPRLETLDNLQSVYSIFERTIVSHFRYEERELEEALGFYNFPF